METGNATNQMHLSEPSVKHLPTQHSFNCWKLWLVLVGHPKADTVGLVDSAASGIRFCRFEFGLHFLLCDIGQITDPFCGSVKWE